MISEDVPETAVSPKSDKPEVLERMALERRMLTGGPFIYGELCKWRAVIDRRGGRTGDDDRLIDRTIQKLRRRGLIDFKRVGRLTVWNATEAALNPGEPS